MKANRDNPPLVCNALSAIVRVHLTFAIATLPILPWLRGGAEGGGVILRN